MPESIKVFFSYSHRDEDYKNELENHLSSLVSNKIIDSWHDRKIIAGEEWSNEIDENLNTAQIILLLVSSDFLASKYCREVEMARALKRHNEGNACVIPIILRPVYWGNEPFARLQAYPKNALPVTKWNNRDEAFSNIAEGIAAAANKIKTQSTIEPSDYEKLSNNQINSIAHQSTNSKVQLNCSLHQLEVYLKSNKWKDADQETLQIFLNLVNKKNREFLTESDIRRIEDEFKIEFLEVNKLWTRYSKNLFGFSIQKRVYKDSSKNNFNAFCREVGWKKSSVLLFSWKTYEELNFTSKAPKGQLPYLVHTDALVSDLVSRLGVVSDKFLSICILNTDFEK
jgi:hypothetical protein